MDIARKHNSPWYKQDAIVSYLLVSEITTGSDHLTTTLVEMEPGGVQRVHAHETEQCYFIIQGQGLMMVGSEMETVGPGDCIFIPSNHPHGLTNEGPEKLIYYSAGAPSFGANNLKTLWPLDSEFVETNES